VGSKSAIVRRPDARRQVRWPRGLRRTSGPAASRSGLRTCPTRARRPCSAARSRSPSPWRASSAASSSQSCHQAAVAHGRSTARCSRRTPGPSTLSTHRSGSRMPRAITGDATGTANLSRCPKWWGAADGGHSRAVVGLPVPGPQTGHMSGPRGARRGHDRPPAVQVDGAKSSKISATSLKSAPASSCSQITSVLTPWIEGRPNRRRGSILTGEAGSSCGRHETGKSWSHSTRVTNASAGPVRSSWPLATHDSVDDARRQRCLPRRDLGVDAGPLGARSSARRASLGGVTLSPIWDMSRMAH
jgi:hypothetical protein